MLWVRRLMTQPMVIVAGSPPESASSTSAAAPMQFNAGGFPLPYVGVSCVNVLLAIPGGQVR